jgi:hypothetical protein
MMPHGTRSSEILTGKTPRFSTIAWTLVLTACVAFGWVAFHADRPGLMEERGFGDYQVRVYRDVNGVTLVDRVRMLLPERIRSRLPARDDRPTAAVEVRRGRHRVYEAQGALFHLPDSRWGWWSRRQPGVAPGTDLNGDGVPNLVVYEWSGSLRDPSQMHVFQAGETFHRIARIEGYDPRFEDLDDDGVPEVVLVEGLFRFDPVFGMPSARVVLRWSTGGYRVAEDLMRQSPPTDDDWARLIKEFRESDEWRLPYGEGGVPQRIFQEALRFMYGGHETWGWRLLREGWKPGWSVDEQLLQRFREQRNGSQYWQELSDARRLAN